MTQRKQPVSQASARSPSLLRPTMPLAAAHILLHEKIIHLQKSQFQNASFLHRKVQTSDSSLARECKSLKTQPSRAGDKSSDYHIFSVTLVGVMGKSPLLTSQGHDFP